MQKQKLTTEAGLALPTLAGVQGKDSHDADVRTGTAYDRLDRGDREMGDRDRPVAAPPGDLLVGAAPPPAGVDLEPTAAAPDRFEADGWWSDPVPPFTYLAGAAGSGKTFLTKAHAESDSGLLLCATTGIAAINLGGETINSVLGYFDTASLQELYISGFLAAKLGRLWKCGVRRLVLDEVSMLAGDQLSLLVKGIEDVNEKGYVIGKKREEDEGPPPSMGLTLVGDFLQLAPVKATYAFESDEWGKFAPHVQTLTEIRRQADPGFIEVLRAAREGRGEAVAEYFLARGALQHETDEKFEGPTILAKNDAVDRYNGLCLGKVQGAPVSFRSARWGKQRSEWGNPEKPPDTWGIPQQLQLKIGALIMVLANRRTPGTGDGIGRRLLYVNGDLGTIEDVGDTTVWDETTGGFDKIVRAAYVRLQRTREVVTVVPVEREVKIPCDSARRKELMAEGKQERIDGKWEIVGGITYMPLRVAYASTTHKSQGLSLDKVQVNIRDGFFKTPGMIYVALSRARSAEGLRLVGSRAALIERCVCDPRLKRWL
jgi:hypothetical protein